MKEIICALRDFLGSRAGLTILLFAGLMLFSTAVVVCAILVPTNERVYLFLVGVAGNFSGSLFTLLHVQQRSTSDCDTSSKPQ